MAGKDSSKARSRPPQAKKPGGSPFTLRLLPVTIFVVFLGLSVRVNDIWRDLFGLEVSPLSSAEAQQPPPPGGRARSQQAAAANAQPTTAPDAASKASTGTPAASSPATPSAADAASDVPPAVLPPGAFNTGEPPTFTQNEIDVLQKLSERRETLDGRERDIVLRENLVKAAESRIDKKIDEMKALQANIQSMLKQLDNQDQEKMKSLVKIYESMKPKDAAKIFNELDLPVLMGVLRNMKEQKVALIMEAMDPAKAREVTDAMLQRRASDILGQGG
ncbi:MAG: hypothetical protein RBR34_03635 [Rhodospirillaceae bacterium]|nr:hypothetical protein [Rhodospirillaceae bacterium]